MTDAPDIHTTLNQLIATRKDDIHDWMQARLDRVTPLPYGSVDLRHSGDKLVPVDTNIFPAGFNNLSKTGRERAADAFQHYFTTQFPAAKRILLVPENHTRNMGYLDNLATLSSLLTQAGYEVAIGRLDLRDIERFDFTAMDGTPAFASGLGRKGDRIRAGLEEFDADVILLNNDLTSGRPELLEGLSQPIVPPMELGWYHRRKSVHFEAYQQIATDFAAEFGLDPWRINALFERCDRINFKERSGLECVALAVERVLHRLREKYAEHGITRTPYVFIKADSGTYGMGIMTAQSGDEIMAINKKIRNKMDVIKEGAQVTEVLIQEGVPTLDRVGDAFAEPVVYLADHRPAGAVWRINPERNAETNLNAAGMQFMPLIGEMSDALCLIARLAMLAAASEEYD